MKKTQADRYAVFYVTPPGESDSEGMFIAKSARGAVRVFRLATGTKEPAWDAHVLSPFGSRAYCNGYMRACSDMSDWEEERARRALAPTKLVRWPHCRICGIIKRRDGKNSRECRGTPRIAPRRDRCPWGSPKEDCDGKEKFCIVCDY